jgi:hypothetical protein
VTSLTMGGVYHLLPLVHMFAYSINRLAQLVLSYMAYFPFLFLRLLILRKSSQGKVCRFLIKVALYTTLLTCSVAVASNYLAVTSPASHDSLWLRSALILTAHEQSLPLFDQTDNGEAVTSFLGQKGHPSEELHTF